MPTSGMQFLNYLKNKPSGRTAGRNPKLTVVHRSGDSTSANRSFRSGESPIAVLASLSLQGGTELEASGIH